MRRTVVYVAAWFAAGAAAIVLASIGVSMVGRQVTADRPSPLSADEVRSELAAGADRSTTSTTSATAPADPAPSPTVPGGSGEPVGSDDGSGPASSAEPGVTAVPGPAPAPPSATTTTAPAPAPETRSYTLVGGSATLRFSASGVTVVSATPNPGFAVETEPTHGTGVRVRFRSDSHESAVEGWWEGGPRDEVREED